ncbi:MAG: zinc ribbon domain-containing protein [Oscillospiraceae bacterium]|nr:zinc ribbon domain-containing protein [Oscillospiraceae bacterium]
MICKHCGKEIDEGLTFCTFCGEPQEETARRPVPEQKNKSLLAPLLIVLAFAAAVAVCMWLFVFRGTEAQEPEQPTLPRVTVDESAYETMAREFAQAILLGDFDTIGADVHPQMKEKVVALFKNTNFLFESCSIRSAEVRKIRRNEERMYESGLYEDYGMEAAIDDAYEVVIAFEAVYRGKPYNGEMTVLVADIDGGRFVVQSALTDMDVAFYEDNYDRGDYYFDTHSEE